MSYVRALITVTSPLNHSPFITIPNLELPNTPYLKGHKFNTALLNNPRIGYEVQTFKGVFSKKNYSVGFNFCDLVNNTP